MMRFINRLEEVLIAVLFAGMTVLTFIQVVLRYVFNSGLLRALEATTYMFGWSGGRLYRHRRHDPRRLQ
jgi:C4-dicarboxylate transporter DctQ subunit